MTLLHYAVGDVHGRDDLLKVMHERIDSDRRGRHPDEPATIVHLGDYVDRGPNSLAVIDRLRNGVAGFDLVNLKGNHEAMMLDCLETDNREIWWRWLRNGGDETLLSFGVPVQFGARNPGRLAEALGPGRIQWLKALKLYYRAGDHLFVHAGIHPGRPLEAQTENELLWIRSPFLESTVDFGFCVVHGHTPMRQPEIEPHRINIDTGAFMTGKLTAVVLGEPEGPRLITVTGPSR
jgi:serine/threonine protein phosphatase 1